MGGGESGDVRVELFVPHRGLTHVSSLDRGPCASESESRVRVVRMTLCFSLKLYCNLVTVGNSDARRPCPWNSVASSGGSPGRALVPYAVSSSSSSSSYKPSASLGRLNSCPDTYTDDTYTEQPATATLLHARELPPSGGGATVFIDMAAALKRTPPELRRQIDGGRRAVHAYNNAGPGGEPPFPPRECASGQNDRMVDVAHPIVRAHPLTGAPVLYFDLDRATGEVSGMGRGESVALLQRLQDLAEAGPRYAHEWRDHDVLIWDNVACQHAATGDFPTGEPRTMWRAMIGGCVPEPYLGREA